MRVCSLTSGYPLSARLTVVWDRPSSRASSLSLITSAAPSAASFPDRPDRFKMPGGRGRLAFGRVRRFRLSNAGLEVANDRAERTRGEESRPEGPRSVLANGRQGFQGGANLRGHMGKLPGDLVPDCVRPLGGGQACGPDRIGGGTQRMRTHVADGGGLPGGSGGGSSSRRLRLAGGTAICKPPANLPGDVQFAAR